MAQNENLFKNQKGASLKIVIKTLDFEHITQAKIQNH